MKNAFQYVLVVVFVVGILINCRPEPVAPQSNPVLPTRDSNLALGNPSNAGTNPNNYLLDKDMFVLRPKQAPVTWSGLL